MFQSTYLAKFKLPLHLLLTYTLEYENQMWRDLASIDNFKNSWLLLVFSHINHYMIQYFITAERIRLLLEVCMTGNQTLQQKSWLEQLNHITLPLRNNLIECCKVQNDEESHSRLLRVLHWPLSWRGRVSHSLYEQIKAKNKGWK